MKGYYGTGAGKWVGGEDTGEGSKGGRRQPDVLEIANEGGRKIGRGGRGRNFGFSW